MITCQSLLQHVTILFQCLVFKICTLWCMNSSLLTMAYWHLIYLWEGCWFSSPLCKHLPEGKPIHFPMVFLCFSSFSHDFPMIFPWFSSFSHGFPIVFPTCTTHPWEPWLQGPCDLIQVTGQGTVLSPDALPFFGQLEPLMIQEPMQGPIGAQVKRAALEICGGISKNDQVEGYVGWMNLLCKLLLCCAI